LIFILRIEIVIGVDYNIFVFAPEDILNSLFAYNLYFPLESL